MYGFSPGVLNYIDRHVFHKNILELKGFNQWETFFGYTCN